MFLLDWICMIGNEPLSGWLNVNQLKGHLNTLFLPFKKLVALCWKFKVCHRKVGNLIRICLQTFNKITFIKQIKSRWIPKFCTCCMMFKVKRTAFIIEMNVNRIIGAKRIYNRFSIESFTIPKSLQTLRVGKNRYGLDFERVWPCDHIDWGYISLL